MQAPSKSSVDSRASTVQQSKRESTRDFFSKIAKGFVVMLFGAVALAGCGDGGSGSGGGANPSSVTLSSVEVSPANSTMAVGSSAQLTATAIYSDNSRVDVSSQATWSSSDQTKATVSGTGNVTGVAAGASSISATFDGVSGSANVNVTAVTLSSIAVTTTTPTIAMGTTANFVATGTYSDGSTQTITNSVAWASANMGTATIVSGGVATPVAPGTTDITASMDGVTSGAVTLTVNAAALTSIAITPASATIIQGLTQAYVATGTYADGSTQTITSSVTWASDNAAASIDAAGVATGASAGAANITASMNGVTSPASALTVNAATLVSIAVTPTGVTLSQSGTSQQQMVATGTYDNGSTANISTSVVWSSSDVSILTVSNGTGFEGLAIADPVNVGSANVIATGAGGVTSPPVAVTVAP